MALPTTNETVTNRSDEIVLQLTDTIVNKLDNYIEAVWKSQAGMFQKVINTFVPSIEQALLSGLLKHEDKPIAVDFLKSISEHLVETNERLGEMLSLQSHANKIGGEQVDSLEAIESQNDMEEQRRKQEAMAEEENRREASRLKGDGFFGHLGKFLKETGSALKERAEGGIRLFGGLFGNAASVLKSIGKRMIFLSPFLIGLLAILTSFESFGNNPAWETVKEKVNKLGTSLSILLSKFEPLLTFFGGDILPKAISALLTGVTWLADGLTWVADSLGELDWQATGQKISDKVSEMFDNITQYFTGIVEMGKGLLNGDMDQFKAGLQEAASGLGNYLLDSFSGGVNLAVDLIRRMFGWSEPDELPFDIKVFVKDVYDSIINWFYDTKANIMNKFYEVKRLLNETIDGMNTAIDEKLAMLKAWPGELANKINDKVIGIKDAITSRFIEGLDAAKGLVSFYLKSTREWMTDIATTVKDSFWKMVETVKDRIHESVRFIVEAKEWTEDIIDSVKSAFWGMVDNIKGAVVGLFADIGNYFSNLGDSLWNSFVVALAQRAKDTFGAETIFKGIFGETPDELINRLNSEQILSRYGGAENTELQRLEQMPFQPTVITPTTKIINEDANKEKLAKAIDRMSQLEIMKELREFSATSQVNVQNTTAVNNSTFVTASPRGRGPMFSDFMLGAP